MTSCAPHIHDGAPDSIPTGIASLPNGTGGTNKTGNPYRVAGQWYTPLQSEGRYDETGIASWYGTKFHGLRTANGEIYDMHALSAAHKTLPLPSLMRVTNLENGKSVIVRVNDRGPFVKDRLIDLSYAAAKALGYAKKGTTHVRVQSLDIPPSPLPATLALGATLKANGQANGQANAQANNQTNTISVSSPDTLTLPATAAVGKIFVQLGAFGLQNNASQLQHRLQAHFPAAHTVAVSIAEKTLYRVRIGPFHDMIKVEQTVLALQQQGFAAPMVIIK